MVERFRVIEGGRSGEPSWNEIITQANRDIKTLTQFDIPLSVTNDEIVFPVTDLPPSLDVINFALTLNDYLDDKFPNKLTVVYGGNSEQEIITIKRK